MRGARLADHHKDLKNFVDILCLTRPEAVTQIHRQYLEAGADIIETNTFGSSPIGMEEFDLPAEMVREINLAAAACARKAADEFNGSRLRTGHGLWPARSVRRPGRRRFPRKVEDPGYRAVTFDQHVDIVLPAGGGAGRRRGRPAVSRNHVRHAESEGLPVRHRAVF